MIAPRGSHTARWLRGSANALVTGPREQPHDHDGRDSHQDAGQLAPSAPRSLSPIDPEASFRAVELRNQGQIGMVPDAIAPEVEDRPTPPMVDPMMAPKRGRRRENRDPSAIRDRPTPIAAG